MSKLNILSGGAAHGLVSSLAAVFKAQTGLDIEGEFGAVGIMADKLRQGVPADLVILTAALVATLTEEKLTDPASIRNIGLVETALAVRTGDPLVSAGDADALRSTLLAADAIFVPDTKSSTAGIHVAKVVEQLGIFGEVADQLRIFPNGVTAMRHLAESDARAPVGCTQSTEIISTKGVTLSGSLPPGCELATVYTAAVTARATAAEQAQRLIELLTSAGASEIRRHAGFVATPG